jgi:hypothetical protein
MCVFSKPGTVSPAEVERMPGGMRVDLVALGGSSCPVIVRTGQ